MAQEVFAVHLSRAGIIENNQVIFAITGKAIVLKVMMDIAESGVNIRHVHVIGQLACKIGILGASQHIAVHAVGAEHYLAAQTFCIKTANIVIEVAFDVFDNPGRRFVDKFFFAFAKMQAMRQNGFG